MTTSAAISDGYSDQDTSFVVGDGTITYDFATLLGGRANGYLACDGDGSMTVAYRNKSNEAYGSFTHTIKTGEKLHFEGISGMKVTALTASSYRLAAWLSRDYPRG